MESVMKSKTKKCKKITTKWKKPKPNYLNKGMV